MASGRGEIPDHRSSPRASKSRINKIPKPDAQYRLDGKRGVEAARIRLALFVILFRRLFIGRPAPPAFHTPNQQRLKCILRFQALLISEKGSECTVKQVKSQPSGCPAHLPYGERVPAVLFLKVDPKDVAVATGGIPFGPGAAASAALIVSLADMPASKKRMLGLSDEFHCASEKKGTHPSAGDGWVPFSA